MDWYRATNQDMIAVILSCHPDVNIKDHDGNVASNSQVSLTTSISQLSTNKSKEISRPDLSKAINIQSIFSFESFQDLRSMLAGQRPDIRV